MNFFLAPAKRWFTGHFLKTGMPNLIITSHEGEPLPTFCCSTLKIVLFSLLPTQARQSGHLSHFHPLQACLWPYWLEGAVTGMLPPFQTLCWNDHYILGFWPACLPHILGTSLPLFLPPHPKPFVSLDNHVQEWNG